MWWQAIAAVIAAARKSTPEQDEALRAERARGVDRLGEEVVRRDGGDNGQAEAHSSRSARSRKKQGQ